MPSRPPLVAVRVDASPGTGGGHLVRCLSLAEALAARGADVLFVSARLTAPLRARVMNAGYRLREIGPLLGQDDVDQEQTVLAEDVQEADALRTRAALEGSQRPDWLVVDHYGLDRVWQVHVRSTASELLVIDDLADRAHDCDLLVDQTLGRLASEYDGLLAARSRALTGARYALLRRQFPEARERALRRDRTAVRRVLVSLGATDVKGVTLEVLERVLAVDARYSVDVVLSSDAASLPDVRALAVRDRRVAVHVDHLDMASLVLRADLAVGAAGTSAWERCCLALPTVTVVLAANQREVAARLASAGAALVVDSLDDVQLGVERLLVDPAERARTSAAAAAVTDGRGAERVADIMLVEGAGGRRRAGSARTRADTADRHRLRLGHR